MISSLRDRLTLLSPVRTADTGGGYEVSYTPKATVAARGTSLSGARRPLADRDLPVRRRKFVLRYRDDLVFEMRLTHQDTTYLITDIQEDEQRRFHTVTAEELRP